MELGLNSWNSSFRWVCVSLKIHEDRVHTCGLNATAYSAFMTVQRASQIRKFARLPLLLLGCSCEFLFAQPQVTGPTLDLPVTNGLIR